MPAARSSGSHADASSTGSPSSVSSRCRTNALRPGFSPSSAVTCGGASLTPACTSSPDTSRLGEFQHVIGGPGPLGTGQRGTAPHETALALLGVDPPVLPQRAQGLDDRRPRHAELAHELMLGGQQRPGG